MEWSAFRDLLSAFFCLLKLKELRDGHNNPRNLELLTALMRAVTSTRKFISTNGYVTSPEIQDLWLDVLEKARKSTLHRAGHLPDYIYAKANFWGDPEAWRSQDASLELVPKLKDLEREIESLRGYLKL